MGESKIQEIVQQKIAHYVTEQIPEDEWEKMIRREMDVLLTGSRAHELHRWIRDELDIRIKKMIGAQLADADYWGRTWGNPAGLFKEVVAEHADKLVEAMFKTTFQNMAQAMKNAIDIL